MITDCIIPIFYSWSEPVARKPHDCCECDAPIKNGERYFYATGKWDEYIESHHQHLACMNACMVIRDWFNDGECVSFGGLMDYAHEYRLDIRDAAKHGNDNAKKFRSLLAQIKWRERKAKA